MPVWLPWAIDADARGVQFSPLLSASATVVNDVEAEAWAARQKEVLAVIYAPGLLELKSYEYDIHAWGPGLTDHMDVINLSWTNVTTYSDAWLRAWTGTVGEQLLTGLERVQLARQRGYPGSEPPAKREAKLLAEFDDGVHGSLSDNADFRKDHFEFDGPYWREPNHRGVYN
jgi:hypothetical protein